MEQPSKNLTAASEQGRPTSDLAAEPRRPLYTYPLTPILLPTSRMPSIQTVTCNNRSLGKRPRVETMHHTTPKLPPGCCPPRLLRGDSRGVLPFQTTVRQQGHRPKCSASGSPWRRAAAVVRPSSKRARQPSASLRWSRPQTGLSRRRAPRARRPSHEEPLAEPPCCSRQPRAGPP